MIGNSPDHITEILIPPASIPAASILNPLSFTPEVATSPVGRPAASILNPLYCTPEFMASPVGPPAPSSTLATTNSLIHTNSLFL